MSLILAFASMYIAGKVVKEVGKDITKIQARKEVVEASKTNSFDVVNQFESILKICEIKRKSHGNSSVKVLPFNGYEKAYGYLDDHHLVNRADIKRFVKHYKKVLAGELSRRQADYDMNYFEIKSQVKNMLNDQYEIVRFEHINVFVDYEDVEMKVNSICNRTFLGDFLVGEVKIKQNSSQSFTEIWALNVPFNMKLSLRDYYQVCAERCGYIY